MNYMRDFMLPVCGVLMYIAAAEGKVPSECATQKNLKHEACEITRRVGGKFLKILSSKVSSEEKKNKLFDLYLKNFDLDAIGRRISVKALGERGIWRKISREHRREISRLAGQFVIEKMVFGKIGVKLHGTTATIEMGVVEVRRWIIVHTTIRGTLTVHVKWYLTKKSKKILDINFNLLGMIQGDVLRWYSNHLGNLANYKDEYIRYKMEYQRGGSPGRAVISMLKRLTYGPSSAIDSSGASDR